MPQKDPTLHFNMGGLESQQLSVFLGEKKKKDFDKPVADFKFPAQE